jgi:uncharacterized membrane protein YraQ (UPF0718 family)
MGSGDVKSVSLASMFGAISSSCSFAALATARALVMKGAHFIAAVAFMFASTNLVIELGILILVFLGWQFLAAEIVGGLILILISRFLMTWTFPTRWMDKARRKVEASGHTDDEAFDWRRRIRSRKGWQIVGHTFVGEWAMVWEEIVIGFTVAGFVAVLVPDSFWQTIFLGTQASHHALNFLIVLQNALLAPFVAAATFIGSMGNIPLATVLNSSGVLFAGIMGFIYSDLMVPPLVEINARYYGWRVALYIAGIMYVSIVATAVILHYTFAAFSLTPESNRVVRDVVRFKIDYTFWLNAVAVVLAGILAWLNHTWHRYNEDEGMDMPGSGKVKRGFAVTAIAIIVSGLVVFVVTNVS